MSKSMGNGSTKIKSLRRKFLTERIVKIWYKRPFGVKSSNSVKDFKINLERFKKENVEDIGSENEAYFSRVSSIVLSKIGVGYFENKRKHSQWRNVWFCCPPACHLAAPLEKNTNCNK